MNVEAKKLIKEHIEDKELNSYLFENKTSVGISKPKVRDCFYDRLKPIFSKLFNSKLDSDDRKNRVVIHTLRHTFASHLAMNGAPILTIQKLMNHKDINMTLRYAKLSPENGFNEVLRLDF